MLSIYFSLLFILLSIFFLFFFFFKQKTAYEMRISDWSSDVCSSDLSAHDSRRAEHSFLCNTRLLVGYGFITVAASAGQDSAACDRHCAAGGGHCAGSHDRRQSALDTGQDRGPDRLYKIGRAHV